MSKKFKEELKELVLPFCVGGLLIGIFSYLLYGIYENGGLNFILAIPIVIGAFYIDTAIGFFILIGLLFMR